VDTDLNAPVFNNGYKEKIAHSIPLQRIATADDIANSIVSSPPTGLVTSAARC
jgi:hypothetical protein